MVLGIVLGVAGIHEFANLRSVLLVKAHIKGSDPVVPLLARRLRSHSVTKMLPGPHALANMHASIVYDLHLNYPTSAGLQNSTEAMP